MATSAVTAPPPSRSLVLAGSSSTSKCQDGAHQGHAARSLPQGRLLRRAGGRGCPTWQWTATCPPPGPRAGPRRAGRRRWWITFPSPLLRACRRLRSGRSRLTLTAGSAPVNDATTWSRCMFDVRGHAMGHLEGHQRQPDAAVVGAGGHPVILRGRLGSRHPWREPPESDVVALGGVAGDLLLVGEVLAAARRGTVRRNCGAAGQPSRCSSSSGARTSPTSRRSPATPPSATTSGLGGARPGGGCPGGFSRWTGWPPAPTTAASGCR